MKCLLMAAIPLALNLTPAKADPLNDIEKSFLASVAATLSAATLCKGVDVKPQAFVLLGDRVGVDGQKMGDATAAAFQAANNLPYDRAALIPEVTQFFNPMLSKIFKEIEAKPAELCPRWIKALRSVGTIE